MQKFAHHPNFIQKIQENPFEMAEIQNVTIKLKCL